MSVRIGRRVLSGWLDLPPRRICGKLKALSGDRLWPCLLMPHHKGQCLSSPYEDAPQREVWPK